MNIVGESIANQSFRDKLDEVFEKIFIYQTDNFVPQLRNQAKAEADKEAENNASGSVGDKKDNDAGSGDPNSDKKSDNSTLLVVIGAAILIGVMMLKKSR